MDEAEADAGLRQLCQEFKGILKMRRAPFKGCSNTWVLNKAGKEMGIIYQRATDNLWFQVFYRDMSDELGMSAGFGTDDISRATFIH